MGAENGVEAGVPNQEAITAVANQLDQLVKLRSQDRLIDPVQTAFENALESLFKTVAALRLQVVDFDELKKQIDEAKRNGLDPLVVLLQASGLNVVPEECRDLDSLKLCMKLELLNHKSEMFLWHQETRSTSLNQVSRMALAAILEK